MRPTDSVATDCSVIVLHASLHILNANNFVMEAADVKGADNSEFIRRDENGQRAASFSGSLVIIWPCAPPA